MSEGTIQDVLENRATWCVVQGDCREVLPTLPVVDALVTDPPYGIGAARKGALGSGGLAKARDYGDDDWDDAPPDDGLISVMRSKAPRQVIFGGNYFTLPPSRCWLVWDKLNGASVFADCELAWTNLDMAVRRLAYRWLGMIRENNEERGSHPTQKPVGVMSWVIDLASDPGEMILDPFAGSGTTGVAAVRLGRRAILIEKDARYAEIARERMRAEENGLTLRDARAGQLPMFPGGAE